MESTSCARRVRFGQFEIDEKTGELRKDGIKTRLQEQPLQILQILLERPGELVSRDELRKRVWPTDTFVDFDHGINNAVKRLREVLGDIAETPRYIETLPRRGYRFIEKIQTPDSRMRSLAVLPLENLSCDPDQEYFVEGMTEALIATLAKVSALRVTSRTTVMCYKGKRQSLPMVARELGVDAIIEGTVLRSGNRVRISVQLIEAASDTHLWAESYERDLRDVLTLQFEVAQAIAREIQVKLTPQERTVLAQMYRVHPEAYEAYLRGRYHWNKRPAEIEKAIELFQQAIDKDPAYAAAYAGLADCLTGLTSWGLISTTKGADKAKGLAQKALEIDPSLSEAHASLALASMYDYEFPDAEREFERAIELDPRYAAAHQFFGFYLAMLGRHEEAYTEVHRALRLEPLSSIISASVGFTYLYARRYDEAIGQCIKTLKLDPNCSPAHGALGWAYRCKSLYEPAIAALEKRCRLWPGSVPIAWLGETYAAAGLRNEALKTVEQLKELAKQQYVTPYGVARIYATLEERAETFRWLETAYRERAEWMVLLKIDPSFDNYRSDLRFQDLMCLMNFPS
jgi:TolB-like protein